MKPSENRRTGYMSGLDRRRFLQLGAAGLFTLAAEMGVAAIPPLYSVGIGKSSDPYGATLRAVLATREWPSERISGKRVVIKPNLVLARPADSGAVTDPEVVRALVDLALEAGAAEVCIVEGGSGGADFTGCGYDFLNGYHPLVRLVDLGDEAVVLTAVPGGMTYRQLYLPRFLLDDDVIFISAAKLKTHNLAYATLSLKNLFGLAPPQHYRLPGLPGLWGMHKRGLHESVVDLNLCRPVDFAVVDGIWAMEGNGPIAGVPLPVDMVVAGANAVAVDRVCLAAMMIPQASVLHVAYASRLGLGPSSFEEITLLGDPFQAVPFKWPTQLPPLMEYPRIRPATFSPAGGGAGQIMTRHYPLPCWRRIDIVRATDVAPQMEFVRTIRSWEMRNPGLELNSWDGRDINGSAVPPGGYFVLVQAKYSQNDHLAFTTGRVDIV